MSKIFIFRDRFDALRIWDGSVTYRPMEGGSRASKSERWEFLKRPENWPLVYEDDLIKYGKQITNLHIDRETVYSFRVGGDIEQDPTIASRNIPHRGQIGPSQGTGNLSAPPGMIINGPGEKRPNFIRGGRAPTPGGIGGSIYFDNGLPVKYKPKKQKEYITNYKYVLDPNSGFYFAEKDGRSYFRAYKPPLQSGTKSVEARSSTKESSFLQRDFTSEERAYTGNMITSAMGKKNIYSYDYVDGAESKITSIEESDDYYKYAGYYGLTYADRTNFINQFEVDPSLEYDPESPLNPDIAGMSFRTQPSAYIISHEETRILAQQMARAVLVGRVRDQSMDDMEIASKLRSMYNEPFHGHGKSDSYLSTYNWWAQTSWDNKVTANLNIMNKLNPGKYDRALIELALSKRFPELLPPKISKSIAEDAYEAASGINKMTFGGQPMEIELMRELDRLRTPYVHALMNKLSTMPIKVTDDMRKAFKPGGDKTDVLRMLFGENKEALRLYNKLFNQYPVSDRPYELGPINKPFGNKDTHYWEKNAELSPFFAPEDMFKYSRFSVHWPEFQDSNTFLLRDKLFTSGMAAQYAVSGGGIVPFNNMLDPSKSAHYTRDLNNTIALVGKELSQKHNTYLTLPIMSRGRFSDFFIINMHEGVTLTLNNFKRQVPIIFNECARRGVKPVIAAVDRYVKTTEHILDTYTGNIAKQQSIWPVAKFYDPSNPGSVVYESRIIDRRSHVKDAMRVRTRTGTGFNTWLAVDFVDPRWSKTQAASWRRMLKETPRRDYYQYDEEYFNMAMRNSPPVPKRETTMLSQRHAFFSAESTTTPGKITTLDQYVDALSKDINSNVHAPRGFFDEQGAPTYTPALLTTKMGHDTYMQEARRTVGIMEHAKILRQKWLFTEELKKIGGLRSDVIEYMQNELMLRLSKVTKGMPVDPTVVPWAGIQIFNPDDPAQRDPLIYRPLADQEAMRVSKYNASRTAGLWAGARVSGNEYFVHDVKMKGRGTGYMDVSPPHYDSRGNFVPASLGDEHKIAYPRYSRKPGRHSTYDRIRWRSSKGIHVGDTPEITNMPRSSHFARAGFIDWSATPTDEHFKNQFASEMYDKDLDVQTMYGTINQPRNVFMNRDIMTAFEPGAQMNSTQAQFDSWSGYSARIRSYQTTPVINPMTGEQKRNPWTGEKLTLITNSNILQQERQKAWDKKTKAAEEYVRNKYPELYEIYANIRGDSRDSYKHSIVVEFMRELHSMDLKRLRQQTALSASLDRAFYKEYAKNRRSDERGGAHALTRAVQLAIADEKRKQRELLKQQRALAERSRRQQRSSRASAANDEEGEGAEDDADDIIPRPTGIETSGRTLQHNFTRDFIAMTTARVNAPWMGNWDIIKHWTPTFNDLIWAFMPPSKYYGYMMLADNFRWMMKSNFNQRQMEVYMGAMARGRAGLTKKPYRREFRSMIWKTTWER